MLYSSALQPVYLLTPITGLFKHILQGYYSQILLEVLGLWARNSSY